MKLQSFDQQDWEGHNGAEGDDPKIVYLDDNNTIQLDGVVYTTGEIVTDENGIHVTLIVDNDPNTATDYICWYYDTDQPTAEYIVGSIAWNSLTRTALEALGFEQMA
jgi:hypothetical protein